MQQRTNAAAPMVRMVAIQFGLLFSDILIALFVDSLRHVAVNLISVYLVQYVLLAANTVILFVRFTHTYPFRAGMIGIMVNEFRGHLFAILLYHLTLIGARSIGTVNMLKCNNARCDPWSDLYTKLHILYRLAALPHYYAFMRAISRLCDPKYYKDSAWLRAKLRRGS
ncbi:transmembrane protein 138-domain-containing protein [Zopfochytrium polystomum]|nr:transmembrane protein 138-domain-containing protein [Zopfochytrium polystomum]